MNTMALKGQWKQLRGELKSEWGKFTENDLLQIEGQLDKLVGLFQQRYGNTREYAVDTLMHYLEGYRSRANEFVEGTLGYTHPKRREQFNVTPWAVPVALLIAGALAARWMMPQHQSE